MSAPRTKRLFAGSAADPSQRQITSFFGPRSPSELLAAAERPLSPPLPASVQSNLLSVGMRIRKSVPEGYKTVAPSAFKLWTDDTPARPPPPATTSSTARSSQRELMPFCGINSVGGLSAQPSFAVMEDDDVPAIDDMPGLTLSQESVESNAASETTRKRTLVDEDEDDDEDVAARSPSQLGGQGSPRGLAPIGWHNGRLMAVPCSRMKKAVPATGLGQENAAARGDFDECDFLVYDRDQEMDSDF